MIYRSGDHIVSVATPPAVLPVLLPDMKDHLRVTHADEDVLITGLIEAAVATIGVNGELGQALTAQTIDEAFSYATKDVYLSVLPATALVSVKYYDGDNALQTAGLGDFALYKSEDWAFVRSENWPTVYDRPDAMTVQYTAGYSSPPQNIIHAVKLIVAHWYQNRENTSELSLKEIPMAASHLLGLSRTGWYG